MCKNTLYIQSGNEVLWGKIELLTIKTKDPAHFKQVKHGISRCFVFL